MSCSEIWSSWVNPLNKINSLFVATNLLDIFRIHVVFKAKTEDNRQHSRERRKEVQNLGATEGSEHKTGLSELPRWSVTPEAISIYIYSQSL